MIDGAPRTPERKRLTELELADLQALSAAFIGLDEDGGVSRTPDHERNAIDFDITKWLEEHKPANDNLDRLTLATLSVPKFYFDAEYVERIQCTDSIDDFPIIHQQLFEKDKKTEVETYRGNWQKSFLKLHMCLQAFNPEYNTQLFVQPRNRGLAFTHEGSVRPYSTLYFDGGRGTVSSRVVEAEEAVGALIDYGKELQEA